MKKRKRLLNESVLKKIDLGWGFCQACRDKICSLMLPFFSRTKNVQPL